MRHLTASLLAGTAALLAATAPALAKPMTERVSVSSAEEQADNSSFAGVGISRTGRFVVFNSLATNLVAQDQNGAQDVFLRDRQKGTTVLVSASSSGEQGNDLSGGPSVSRDGRFVVFSSRATNLVPGDTDGFSDVFVRDRKTGQTTLVTVDRTGGPADGNSVGVGGVSDDGTVVAFRSEASDLVEGDTNVAQDVFVRDLRAGTTTRIAQGNNVGNVSANGRYVAFSSSAPDLVPGDTNDEEDDFVYDRRTGRITRVNVSTIGEQAVFGGAPSRDPQISANGKAVAFVSFAGNLVPGDTNGASDVFVRTR